MSLSGIAELASLLSGGGQVWLVFRKSALKGRRRVGAH